MYIKTYANISSNKHVYTSIDIDYPHIEELKNYEKVKNTISTMVINFESDYKININYIFNNTYLEYCKKLNDVDYIIYLSPQYEYDIINKFTEFEFYEKKVITNINFYGNF